MTKLGRIQADPNGSSFTSTCAIMTYYVHPSDLKSYSVKRFVYYMLICRNIYFIRVSCMDIVELALLIMVLIQKSDLCRFYWILSCGDVCTLRVVRLLLVILP